MKLFSYTWVRYAQLNQMRQDLAARKDQMAAAGQFIQEIGNGNLEASYKHFENGSAGTELSASLIGMRDQMKKISLEEKQRNWVTEGLAKFVEILRSKNNDLHEFSNSITSNLVKYMGANQGALYLINDDNVNDEFLEMVACYAYGRKKHLSQRIEFGQGLAGQVVLEKSTLYMTNIPNNYLKITSGLGEALPKNLLIVPLKLDEKIFGILEIASFETIHPYQIQFVERLGESIASTIASVKVNQKTGQLLRETQVQAEQMRSQEEEMRQNMEELTATQEEMQRILKEVQGQERYMNELIDSSTDSILVIDRSYKVVSANKTLKQTYAALGIDVVKGLDVSQLFDKTEWPKYKAYYDHTFTGESTQRTELFKSHGFELYFLSQHTPIRDSDGNVIASAVFAKDVTELVKAQKTAEALASDQQQKNEELKAQEEELRQNMEELSATQEEMERILKEVQGQESYMNELINSSSDSILVVDKELKVKSTNKTLRQSYAAMGVDVDKGFDVLKLFNDAERPKYQAFYERALGGESFHLTERYQSHGFDSYFLIQYTPIRNNEGEVTAAAVFAKDISDMMKAQNEVKALANEAQQRNEELKAQEEELRQNMEELSATQDEMQRIILEVQSKEKYLDDIINISTDVIFTVDREYKVLTFNKAMAEGMDLLGVKLTKGFPILSIFDEKKRSKQQVHYDRAFNGECFQLTEHFDQHGLNVYSLINYAPITNEKEEIIAVVVFSKDVSESQRMLNEMKQNESNLKEVINASSDSIWTVDCNHKLTSFNKNFAKVFSARNVEVVKGMDMISVLEDHEQKVQVDIYARVFAGESFQLNQTFTHQGVDTHIVLNYHPLRNDKHQIYGAAIYAKDVTSLINTQNLAKQLIHESHDHKEEQKARERERAFVATTVMYEMDIKGLIQELNDGLSSISGYTKKELLGKPHNVLWHPDMPCELFQTLWSKIRQGDTFRFMVKNKAKDGEAFWTETTVVPAKNVLGKITKYIVMEYLFTDETMACVMYEKQLKKFQLPSPDSHRGEKRSRNGHEKINSRKGINSGT